MVQQLTRGEGWEESQGKGWGEGWGKVEEEVHQKTNDNCQNTWVRDGAFSGGRQRLHPQGEAEDTFVG